MKQYTELELLEMNTGHIAYIGDAVFELFIRQKSLEHAGRRIRDIHKETVSFVCAESQAEIILSLVDHLTAEEQNLVRRARNAKTGTTAKHASIGDYRKATGFECLIGYLYLKGDMKRLIEIFNMIESQLFNKEKEQDEQKNV